jgi:hypothetical protein
MKRRRRILGRQNAVPELTEMRFEALEIAAPWNARQPNSSVVIEHDIKGLRANFGILEGREPLPSKRRQ